MASRSRCSLRLRFFHCRCGKRCYVAGKIEGSVQPELETHADKVAAVLLNEASLAVEMGKASLAVQPMSPLAGIAIRYPDVGLVTSHGVANNMGGAAEHGAVDHGFGRAGCLAACRAAAGHPAVLPHKRLDLGQVDLVIFPDHLGRRILDKWQAAMLAMRRAMVFVCIGRFGQRTSVPFMPRLGTTRPRTVSLRLPVRQRRLRRRSQRLARALQTQQQVDQLRLRKPLEFLAIHEQCESRQPTLGKEAGNYLVRTAISVTGISVTGISVTVQQIGSLASIGNSGDAILTAGNSKAQNPCAASMCCLVHLARLVPQTPRRT